VGRHTSRRLKELVRRYSGALRRKRPAPLTSLTGLCLLQNGAVGMAALSGLLKRNRPDLRMAMGPIRRWVDSNGDTFAITKSQGAHVRAGPYPHIRVITERHEMGSDKDPWCYILSVQPRQLHHRLPPSTGVRLFHDGVKRRRVGVVYAGHGGAWVITLRDNSSGRPHGPSRGGGAEEQESFYGVEPWVYFQVEQQTAQLLERVKV
jgi:hypothetical protein